MHVYPAHQRVAVFAIEPLAGQASAVVAPVIDVKTFVFSQVRVDLESVFPRTESRGLVAAGGGIFAIGVAVGADIGPVGGAFCVTAIKAKNFFFVNYEKEVVVRGFPTAGPVPGAGLRITTRFAGLSLHSHTSPSLSSTYWITSPVVSNIPAGAPDRRGLCLYPGTTVSSSTFCA